VRRVVINLVKIPYLPASFPIAWRKRSKKALESPLLAKRGEDLGEGMNRKIA
jgi:hypothetical protein